TVDKEPRILTYHGRNNRSSFLLLKFKEFQCFFQEQIRIFWIFLGYFYFPLNFFQIICNHSIYS
uniref:hypothetical protein n=1 Tax=Streptococcus pneumoniae TaxID=1313 RepID=UPI00209E2B1F